MELYIQTEFIHHFTRIYDIDNDTHRELKRFFVKSKGKVFVQASSVSEFEKQAIENPLLEILLNNCSPKILSKFDNSLADTDCNYTSATKYFFLAEDSENIQQRYGYFCTTISSIERASFLFHPYLNLKISNKYTDWSFIKHLKHPCNSLIVTDNYLLQDTAEIEENFLQIIKYLLPDKLEAIDFHLTIIGKVPEKTKDHPLLPNRYNQLLTEISKMNLPYSVNLSIIKSEVHDRNIYTNYVWINSGNSFTHFRNKSLRHDTHLICFPVSYLQKDFIGAFETFSDVEIGQSIFSVYFEKCEFFRDKALNQLEKAGLIYYVCGSRNNRLFPPKSPAHPRL